MEFQTDPDSERPKDVPALCEEKMSVAELIELLKEYPPEYKVWGFNPLTSDATWVYANTVDHYGDNVYVM